MIGCIIEFYEKLPMIVVGIVNEIMSMTGQFRKLKFGWYQPSGVIFGDT